MKYCIKCNKPIDEFNIDVKYCMIITKKGQRILEFECFHFSCWKKFIKENLELLLESGGEGF